MNYNTLATQEVVEKTIKGLNKNHFEAISVKIGVAALSEIKKLIPQGSSVMNGASKTLEQIGFVEYLKSGAHGWNNLHAQILAEKDPVKQGQLRKQSTLSDFYLGSVHALTENGELLIASNTGSQLPHIVFSSQNLIFVVSTKKIVPNLDVAMKRLEEHVVPLEDVRMKEVYGVGTQVNKIVIFKNENPMMGRKVHVILVAEDLGF
jgi:L-lactate utilization protein LutC